MGVTESAGPDTDRLHSMLTGLFSQIFTVYFDKKRKMQPQSATQMRWTFLGLGVNDSTAKCALWLQCQLDSVQNRSDQQLT